MIKMHRLISCALLLHMICPKPTVSCEFESQPHRVPYCMDANQLGTRQHQHQTGFWWLGIEGWGKVTWVMSIYIVPIH